MFVTLAGHHRSMRAGARKIILGGLVFLTAQGAFSLATRLISGEDDLAHPLIHLASGSLGLALARSPRLLARFTLGFGAAYLLVLGVGGATGFVDPSWLALGTVDHIFHVTLGSAALVAAAVSWRSLRGGAA